MVKQNKKQYNKTNKKLKNAKTKHSSLPHNNKKTPTSPINPIQNKPFNHPIIDQKEISSPFQNLTQKTTFHQHNTFNSVQRRRGVNHLMWLIKKNQNLPFNKLLFKSVQYLDIYFQNVKVIPQNSLKTVILAVFYLACQSMGYQEPYLPEIIDTIYNFQFGQNQVEETKQQVLQIISGKDSPTVYDTFLSYLRVLEPHVRIQKDFLRKSHHYLRLSLLVSLSHELIAQGCLLFANRVCNSGGTLDTIDNLIINKLEHEQILSAINFICMLDEQFENQKHICLMVNQMKHNNTFT